MMQHRESRVGEQVGDVAPRPGREVVDADYPLARRQQSLAEVRTDEPGAARDQRGSPANANTHNAAERPAAEDGEYTPFRDAVAPPRGRRGEPPGRGGPDLSVAVRAA